MAAMGEAVREMERVTVSAMVRCGLNEAGCGDGDGAGEREEATTWEVTVHGL